MRHVRLFAIALLFALSACSDGSPINPSTLDSDAAVGDASQEQPVNVNGVIETFSGDAAGFQLTVETQIVQGDGATEFFGNSAFSELAVGRRVEVKGVQRDGFVYARRVHVNVEDDADDDEGNDDGPNQDDSASIEGELTTLGGTGDVLLLTVDGTTVHTSATTVVQRRGDTQDLSVLALGMRLHVVGDRQPDGSIIARRIQIKGDAAGGTFQIEGSLGGLKGACPAVRFGVNGYSVVTDDATTFTLACEDLKPGSKVRVTGVVEDGVVRATEVRKR